MSLLTILDVSSAFLFLLEIYSNLLDIFLYSSQLLVTIGLSSTSLVIAWVQTFFLLTDLQVLEVVGMCHLRLFFSAQTQPFLQPIRTLCKISAPLMLSLNTFLFVKFPIKCGLCHNQTQGSKWRSHIREYNAVCTGCKSYLWNITWGCINFF